MFAVKHVKNCRKRIKSGRPVIGVCIGYGDFSFKITPAEKFINKINNALNRFRVVPEPIYCAKASKMWGTKIEQHTANMEALIKLILAKNYNVILIGGKQELKILEGLSPEVINKCADYVGRTSVAESIALASLCDICVGIDTGMQHIADALGIKTVSIFGPTNPKVCGAYSDKAVFAEVNEHCRYCYFTDSFFTCRDRHCMTKITPEYVFKLVKQQLIS